MLNEFPGDTPPWEQVELDDVNAQNQETVSAEASEWSADETHSVIDELRNHDHACACADAAQDVDHAPADVAVDKPEGLEVLHERKPCYKGKDGAEDLRFLGKSQQCVLVLTQKISHVHEQCGACPCLDAEREPEQSSCIAAEGKKRED